MTDQQKLQEHLSKMSPDNRRDFNRAFMHSIKQKTATYQALINDIEKNWDPPVFTESMLDHYFKQRINFSYKKDN